MAVESSLLKSVPLFALLDQAERAELAGRVDVLEVSAGSVLFNADDPGDSLYVVSEGEVEIFIRDDTGERIVLERVGPGGFFGEMSLLDGGPRTASAVAVEDLRALMVDRADLEGFLGKCPTAALDFLAATGRRLRETDKLLRHTASRNVNQQLEDQRTRLMKAADWIADFSGSIPFLGIHLLLFAVWIVWNVGVGALLPGGGFDPFPFGLLTTCVSLEAIILSVFVLLSQNRQAERERARNEIEYQVNLKAEL